jgi:hypothetical protein
MHTCARISYDLHTKLCKQCPTRIKKSVRPLEMRAYIYARTQYTRTHTQSLTAIIFFPRCIRLFTCLYVYACVRARACTFGGFMFAPRDGMHVAPSVDSRTSTCISMWPRIQHAFFAHIHCIFPLSRSIFSSFFSLQCTYLACHPVPHSRTSMVSVCPIPVSHVMCTLIAMNHVHLYACAPTKRHPHEYPFMHVCVMYVTMSTDTYAVHIFTCLSCSRKDMTLICSHHVHGCMYMVACAWSMICLGSHEPHSSVMSCTSSTRGCHASLHPFDTVFISLLIFTQAYAHTHVKQPLVHTRM